MENFKEQNVKSRFLQRRVFLPFVQLTITNNDRKYIHTCMLQIYRLESGGATQFRPETHVPPNVFIFYIPADFQLDFCTKQSYCELCIALLKIFDFICLLLRFSAHFFSFFEKKIIFGFVIIFIFPRLILYDNLMAPNYIDVLRRPFCHANRINGPLLPAGYEFCGALFGDYCALSIWIYLIFMDLILDLDSDALCLLFSNLPL